VPAKASELAAAENIRFHVREIQDAILKELKNDAFLTAKTSDHPCLRCVLAARH